MWTSLQGELFQALKYSLTYTPMLQLFDFTRPFFVVVSDESGKGVSATLLQDNHPISFESCKV